MQHFGSALLPPTTGIVSRRLLLDSAKRAQRFAECHQGVSRSTINDGLITGHPASGISGFLNGVRLARRATKALGKGVVDWDGSEYKEIWMFDVLTSRS